MRSKTKKISILIIVGFVFPLLVNLRFNFSVEQNFIENIECSALQAPIFINGSATGVNAHNWTWAEEQPWCSGSGTDIDPYVIQNLTINGFETVSCIEIRNSIAFFIIKDCTLYNSSNSFPHAGIKLVNVNNGTLFNNNCSFNQNFGIFLSESDFNNITENTANNNNGGIGIIMYIDCNNNIVSGNTANNNHDGIYIGESDNNIITGNTANYNKYGITDQWAWYNTFSRNIVNYNTESGMYFSTSNFASVSDNTVNGNIEGITLENWNYNSTFAGNNINGNDYGIFLYRSDFNNISGNNIKNNEYGIYFEVPNPSYSCDDYNITKNILYNNTIGIYFELDSDNNSIYENFFLKNGKHAIDEGTDNTWNSTTIGNYWDNHTGPDVSPIDGIVDDPYTYIGGSTGSIDYLPIAEDGAPVIAINSPSQGSFFGVSAPSFDVTITDDYLDSMWYTLDGGLHNYTFTENSIINQSVWDSITDGSVTLTFFASDIPKNIGFSEVSLIKDATAPTIVVNSPTSGEEFGNNAPSFNISVTDNHLDLIWYSFDGGLTTYIITTNTSFNQLAWSALPEGSVTITFYANDTSGNEESEDVIITKSIPIEDPGTVIITIIIVFSVVGGVVLISVAYLYLKKRSATA